MRGIDAEFPGLAGGAKAVPVLYLGESPHVPRRQQGCAAAPERTNGTRWWNRPPRNSSPPCRITASSRTGFLRGRRRVAVDLVFRRPAVAYAKSPTAARLVGMFGVGGETEGRPKFSDVVSATTPPGTEPRDLQLPCDSVGWPGCSRPRRPSGYGSAARTASPCLHHDARSAAGDGLGGRVAALQCPACRNAPDEAAPGCLAMKSRLTVGFGDPAGAEGLERHQCR